MERKRIGEILVDLKALDKGDIERVLQALRRRGGQGKFGQVARDMGLIREEHILAAIAVQLQLVPALRNQRMSGLLRRLSKPHNAPSVRGMSTARIR